MSFAISEAVYVLIILFLMCVALYLPYTYQTQQVLHSNPWQTGSQIFLFTAFEFFSFWVFEKVILKMLRSIILRIV